MDCVACGSAAVTERPERTAQGCRRFRCRICGKQFNERSAGVLNRARYPSDVVALVVLWRLRYRFTLRDLSEMFLHRGIVFSHEAVRDWEAKLAPVLSDELRQRRRGKCGTGRRSWFVDETHLKGHRQLAWTGTRSPRAAGGGALTTRRVVPRRSPRPTSGTHAPLRLGIRWR